jgi:hypothetical protein
MENRPEQPPEGRLIAAAAKIKGISIREASRRAGISYGRWRQITTGVQNVSPGQYAAVRNVPARTIARMAAAVELAPEQVESEGQRPDAADIMRSGNATPIAPARRGTVAPILQGIDMDELAGEIERLDEDIEAFRPWRDDYEKNTWADPLLSLDDKRRLIGLYRHLRHGGASGSGRARSGLSPPAAAPSHRRGGAALSPAAV